MNSTTYKEKLIKTRTQLNEQIAWLNHHIEWLKNELKKNDSSYYKGLLEAYIEVKHELNRISNSI